MNRRVLRNDQWRRIAPRVPGKGAEHKTRLFVEAVLWIARTGAPWRDLPPKFGDWNTTYKRFARWADAGVWQNLFTTLAADADFEEVFVDSTIVRAHQHAAGAPQKKAIRHWVVPEAD